MPKYLYKASYTTEGFRGVLKEGGSARAAEVSKVMEGLGGHLEAFYFAFGETDVFIIADMPDNESAAAASMAATSSGTIMVSIVVLLTPEEIDAAANKMIDFRPPGR